jgi:hypothetical protein
MGHRGWVFLRLYALIRLRLSSMALSCALTACFLSSCAHPQAEYFAGSGPILPNYMGPFGVVIYKVDPECDSLRKTRQ